MPAPARPQVFAMQELPGEFTTFDFIPGIPAPFNFGLAILLNQKMLTLGEKIQTAPPLLPMACAANQPKTLPVVVRTARGAKKVYCP